LLAQEATTECGQRFLPYQALGTEPYYLYPTESLWNSTGGHRIICMIIHDDRGDWTGSVVG
jgi:hypothetical protein